MTCKNHNALRDHVPFRALYTTLPVKVRHLMGKWGHYRRKVKFNLIIIIFGQVRRARLKSPTGRIRPGRRTLPMSALAPSEKWPTQEISDRFEPFLLGYRVNIARCNLCARAKVKGHIKLKIEENTSVGKLVEPFQIW